MPVALVARVGADALADLALAGLSGVDLRIARDSDRPTGTCVVLVGPDGERTMLSDAGANVVAPALPEDLLAPGRVLFLSGYALLRDGSRAGALAVLAAARTAGMRIALGLASAALIPAGFAELAGPVDLPLGNEAEAARLAGLSAEVVITVVRGAGWSDGRRTVHAPAPRVAGALDTTGAGDAFAAGFLSAWPGPPDAALRQGARLVAEAVTRHGGRPA